MVKKFFALLLTVLLLGTFLVGCSTADEPLQDADTDEVVGSDVSNGDSVGTDVNDGADVNDGGATSSYVDEAYAAQIERYYVALSEKWDEGKYFENGMSALPYYYYEGNPLENVGFGYIDLDNDGQQELVIGAIQNSDKDPAVFEIWTLVDGKPVMLAQGGSRNRYVLQYVEEDGMWYVANEGSNSAANHVTYYFMLNEGKFEVVQGVLFDATADAQNPWFLTYDTDWDVSNDMPIDEATANAILDSNRVHYIAAEYYPYSYYR